MQVGSGRESAALPGSITSQNGPSRITRPFLSDPDHVLLNDANAKTLTGLSVSHRCRPPISAVRHRGEFPTGQDHP